MRRELGLSQREAAEQSGISFGQWQGLEDDERQSRGLDVKVRRIVLAFKVDRDWLMWGGPLLDPGQSPIRWYDADVRHLTLLPTLIPADEEVVDNGGKEPWTIAV